MAKRDNSDPPGGAPAPAEQFPSVILRSIGKPVDKGGFGVLEMEVPVRWFPGSVLSHDDALFINYALAYYAGSNFVNRMKKLQEEKKSEAEIREIFAAYVAKYEWSPAGKFDPVESEARKIARDHLSSSLGAGIKLADYDDDIVDRAIERLLDEDPSIRAGARAIVEARTAAKSSATPIDLNRLGL